LYYLDQRSTNDKILTDVAVAELLVKRQCREKEMDVYRDRKKLIGAVIIASAVTERNDVKQRSLGATITP